jgi:high-affinity nickel permease
MLCHRWFEVDFDFLFKPLEDLDTWLTHLLNGAPLLVALLIALVLGLRHASDPDHLVAVTSLVAVDGGDTRRAARLGAWWGLGHAGVLIVLGLPLVFLKAELPSWLEAGAEKAIGVVVIALSLRVIVKWARGDFRAGRHKLPAAEQGSTGTHGHRHLRRGQGSEHPHRLVRSPRQALAIGTLHGLAGTGAVVLLLVAALPSQLEAAAALAIFAAMSMVSMTLCTAAFAWALTRPVIEPLYRRLVLPAMGTFGLIFGLWYAGLT